VLVEEVVVLDDTQARIDLYAQAEQILIEDEAAIIPIYFYASNEMTKPNVERSYSITGQQRFEEWDITN
jgi:oligopeptide transport system substrate-binding protein